MQDQKRLTPFVSIIIPTRNNEQDLFDCLKSIKDLDYSLNRIEIIIWDNDSNQVSRDKINTYLINIQKRRNLNIEFIEHNGNLGVYTSRDELLKRISSDTDFILSIDDDVILPPQILENLLPLFYENKSIGIVGPKTVYDDLPSVTAHGAGFINWWTARYTDLDAESLIECDYVIGCCMLIKKIVINEIGGFDRDYYTSHGEVDFCLRARQKDYRTLYQPEVIVRHRVERTGTQTLERIYYVFRNKLFVIKKNAPFPQKWVALSLYCLFWPLKALFDSIRKNRRIDVQEIKVILKAIKDAWLGRSGKII